MFPLRFETPGAVVGALAGLAVHGLPIEELVEYRDRGSRRSTSTRSRRRLGRISHVDRAAIVLVGDADAFGPALEAAGLGQIVIDRDEAPHAAGPLAESTEVAVDEGEETGPTAGAEDPDLPGTADDPTAADDRAGRRARERLKPFRVLSSQTGRRWSTDRRPGDPHDAH